MAQIKLAEYTFDNSVGDVTLTLTPNTITMTAEDTVSGTTTRRIVYIDNATMPTQITFNVREPLLTVDYLNIDSNITSMVQLFYNAKSLNYINVDNWNTSNVTDLYQCFYGTRALTQNIDFTKMNLSKVIRWHHVFAYSSLPRIDLSHISPTLTDSSKTLFGYCKAEYINIGGWTFTNTMGQLFSNATELKTVVLDNVTTTGVTDMSDMFRNCYNLKTINVSSFDTSSVTTFSHMFHNCGIATKIKGIENFNVSSVQNFSNMFNKCSSLTKLDLSSWDVSQCTNMSNMFNGCSSLRSLDLSSWDTSSCTNMNYIFQNCSSLTLLDLSNFNVTNASLSSAFQNCNLRQIGLLYSNATSINKITGNLYASSNCDIYYYDADPTQLTPVEGVTFKKYVASTTIQLPPHIQLHSLPDGTRDEVDIKTGILIRRTQKVNNEIIALESPTTEQLILNYNNSCNYGRVLPTGMCDKYDVVNSMYTQTMTSILLDGENTWDAMEEMTNVIKFTATGTTVGVEELNMLGAGGLYCDNDLFPNINDDSDVEHCRVDEAGNKFYIYINKDRLMSPDLIGYQIWLQENNFNMIYELAEHLTYVKPYKELNATQARWEGMDCMRDGTISYHTNSSDNITMYPTLEYVAPSINNFEVPMLEPNTDYTIYAEGINTNDTINLGGTDINFNNGTVVTSGDNQWLRIDNNDSFYNMVITKGDTTGEAVSYFEGMTSVENPKVQCGESIVSYTDLKLRSLPNGVKDTINVVTGEYIQRVGKREYQDGDLTNENVLTDGINTMYELENYIITKLDPQTLLAYTDGTINLSSDTGLLPTTHYTVPSTNTFHLPSMKTGTRYTLKYPSASGSITIGNINYSISSDSMLFTTPLKINGDTSLIIFSDTNPENVVLLEGVYNTREVPYFTGVKSVKNPNITIIDQLSTESNVYSCATDIELRGLPNGIADSLDIVRGKLTTVVGVRVYQEGDEELDNVWTDGYETVYALDSPVVTNVEFETPYVTANSSIELSSDDLIPQLNYRAPSSNNFPLDLLQPNQTYTLYADTLVTGTYTLGGTYTNTFTDTHTITLGNVTEKLLTFNGDLGLSNVMLIKGNSLKSTLPKYFRGLQSVTNANFLIEGYAGETNEMAMDEGIVLRDCNGVKDTIDLITCTLTKCTGEITLTGAEGWNLDSSVQTHEDYVVFRLILNGVKYSRDGNLICDTLPHKYLQDLSHETEAIYGFTNMIRVCVKKSRIGGDNVNAFKSWLNQNPTTVIYTLTTPLEIPLENVWTLMPPTSYDNQTEITTTVTNESLKPMISVTIATTTLEQIVSDLEAQNAKLEAENIATMLALTSVYETMVAPMAVATMSLDDEVSTVNLSDGKDGNNVNGMSVSPIGMVYVNLIKKGYKTIEQVPANLQAEVKYALKGIE